MKLSSDAGRLHHGAPLLQAAEQHGHAHRSPLVGTGQQLAEASSRTRPPPGGRSRRSSSRSRSRRTRRTSRPTTRPRATSRSAPATSRTRSGRARSPRLPPATGSTSTPRPHRSRPTRGTRRTTGSTPCSTRARPRTRAGRTSARVTPADGASEQAASTHPTVTFDEAMTASTVNATTITLKDDQGAAVASTVAYDAATRTATLTPSAPLALGRSYTVTVAGGPAGVKDGAGQRGSPPTSARRSARPPLCPCSVFKSHRRPARRRPGRLARSRSA